MPNTLFSSLGTSPAVVLEALYSGPNGDCVSRYQQLYVITSDNNQKSIEALNNALEQWSDAPDIYEIEVIHGFGKLQGQSDHDLFQEEVYSFFLKHGYPDIQETGSDTALPDICISGGYKSMSSAMHHAAHILGARRVYHVFADPYPKMELTDRPRFPDTISEITEGYRTGQIRVVEMGAEPGRLSVLREITALRLAENKSAFIRQQFKQLDQLHGRIEAIHTLPFPALARLDEDLLKQLGLPAANWLNTRLFETMPKIELHCHMGGFATHGQLLEKVKAARKYPISDNAQQTEPKLPEGWPEPQEAIALNDYRALGDATGSNLLKDPGCLEMHLCLLYQHLQQQRVVYAEIRCSPNNYAAHGRTPWQVLEHMKSVFDNCLKRAKEKGEWQVQINLIIIVTRNQGGDLSSISRHLALAVSAFNPEASHSSCQVVGVDLAGFENKDTRPMYFETDFNLAHRTGLAVTVHAGENDDVESVWQAVFRLKARRLGHALNLLDAPDLLRAVADRKIGVEMCPYANLQIKGFNPMPGQPVYPLKEYLDKGVLVTVNTDNIGISAAGLSENLRLLTRMNPELSMLDIIRLQANALEVAFTGRPQYRELYDQTARLMQQAVLNSA